MSMGKLYGIGVGPGDPELLTIKARRILENIEVLFIPKSKQEKRSLAFSIVKTAITREWELIELILPMTLDQEILQRHWQKAARDVLEVLENGRDAAFITLGDPGMYSTMGYLLNGIKQRNPSIEVEIIPGISSINAISALIQEPLAEGDESLAIIPAFNKQEYIAHILDEFDNVVLLKAGQHIGKIADTLTEHEIPARVFLASRSGFEEGFIDRDLIAYKDKKLDYLTTVVIKKKREEGWT